MSLSPGLRLGLRLGLLQTRATNRSQTYITISGLPDNAYLDGLTHEPEKLTYHRVHRVSQGKICLTQSSRSTQRSSWAGVYDQEISGFLGVLGGLERIITPLA